MLISHYSACVLCTVLFCLCLIYSKCITDWLRSCFFKSIMLTKISVLLGAPVRFCQQKMCPPYATNPDKKTEGRGVIHSNVHIHLLNFSISSKSKDLKFTKLLFKNILMAKAIEKWSLDGVSSKSRWRSKSKCGEDLRSRMWLCWQNCSLDPYKHTVF